MGSGFGFGFIMPNRIWPNSSGPPDRFFCFTYPYGGTYIFCIVGILWISACPRQSPRLLWGEFVVMQTAGSIRTQSYCRSAIALELSIISPLYFFNAPWYSYVHCLKYRKIWELYNKFYGFGMIYSVSGSYPY